MWPQYNDFNEGRGSSIPPKMEIMNSGICVTGLDFDIIFKWDLSQFPT
jgi:hypothetical protein